MRISGDGSAAWAIAGCDLIPGIFRHGSNSLRYRVIGLFPSANYPPSIHFRVPDIQAVSPAPAVQGTPLLRENRHRTFPWSAAGCCRPPACRSGRTGDTGYPESAVRNAPRPASPLAFRGPAKIWRERYSRQHSRDGIPSTLLHVQPGTAPSGLVPSSKETFR